MAIIDGKQISKEVLDELRTEIQDKKLNLKMAAILVSNDAGLKKFVELKEKAAIAAGIGFENYFFEENISEDELKKELAGISANPKIDGVFIELPLPGHLSTQKVLDAIPAGKDLDVLCSENQKKFFDGDFSVLPPAVESVKIIFDKYGINPSGKKVTLFGYGFLIGKPVAYWLEKQGAEVSVIRSKTENPGEISKKADVIISGVGKPDLIKGDMIKDEAVIIDFGYGRKGDKMVGDVEFDSVAPKAGLVAPVPGGMGPILIAAVLKNLIKLNKK